MFCFLEALKKQVGSYMQPYFEDTNSILKPGEIIVKMHLSQYMRFPTMWHFDMCILGRASAVSF